MNQIFAANLSAIRINSPRSAAFLENYSLCEQPELTYSSTGKLCAKRHGIALHSFYEPEKEAQKNCEIFLKNNLPQLGKALIILGAGLFYHVRVLQQHFGHPLVFEPDTDLLYTLLSFVDLTEELKHCTLITGSSDNAQTADVQNLIASGKQLCIYRHAPSVRHYESVFNDFANQLTVTSSSANVKLKIVLAGPVYGGSLPIYYYCKKALEELGHEVIGLDFSIHRQAMDFYEKSTVIPANRQKLMNRFVQNLAETILITALENEADLVFGIAQAPFTAEVIQELKKRKIVTAFWFVEDFRTLLYWQNYAGLYDHFFVIQKDEFFKELKKVGCRNFAYLPTAADPQVHKKMNLSPTDQTRYGSELSFVGAGYYNRRRAFLTLLNYDFKIWGNDWDLHSSLSKMIQEDARRISSEETVKIFNASKINLNLHSSSYVEDVNPDGDFINPRTFEIAASENFQLVDRRSLLRELYNDDEIATYNSLDDLKEKIAYYLNHPAEREKITHQGYLKTIERHTYRHRMQQMIQQIIAAHPHLSAKRSWQGNRAILQKQAEERNLPELVALFSEIQEENLTLEIVIKHLETLKKPLDRTGGILLMMQEFWNFANRKKMV